MSQGKNKKYTKHHKQKSLWPLAALIIGGSLLLLGAVFVFSQSSKPKATIEVTGSPSLIVDKEKVDLGNVKLGQTVQVSFQLTNVGDQTLGFSKSPCIEVLDGC